MRCQQYELYAAECERGVRQGQHFADAAHMQRYVDELREDPWWVRTVPQVRRIEVYTDRRKKGSVGFWDPVRGAGLVEFGPVEHRRELVVLHEVAHVVTHARAGEKGAHGPAFARTYLELVGVYMGPDAYLGLRAAFDLHGIQHEWNFGPRLGSAREMGPAS